MLILACWQFTTREKIRIFPIAQIIYTLKTTKLCSKPNPPNMQSHCSYVWCDYYFLPTITCIFLLHIDCIPNSVLAYMFEWRILKILHRWWNHRLYIEKIFTSERCRTNLPQGFPIYSLHFGHSSCTQKNSQGTHLIQRCFLTWTQISACDHQLCPPQAKTWLQIQPEHLDRPVYAFVGRCLQLPFLRLHLERLSPSLMRRPRTTLFN